MEESWYNVTLRAGSNQMWAMDEKSGRKFIWSGLTLTLTHISINSVTFLQHILYGHQCKKLVVMEDKHGVFISKKSLTHAFTIFYYL